MPVITIGLCVSRTVLSFLNYPSSLSQRGPLTNYMALLEDDWPVITGEGQRFSIAVMALMPDSGCTQHARITPPHCRGPRWPLPLVPGDSVTQTAFCHVSDSNAWRHSVGFGPLLRQWPDSAPLKMS